MTTQTQNDTVSKKAQYIWPCANTYYREPLVVERAEGLRVWDTEARSYLDFFGGDADPESHIPGGTLPDREHQPDGVHGKRVRLHCQFVFARRQPEEGVEALSVADGAAGHVGRDILCRDRGARSAHRARA